MSGGHWNYLSRTLEDIAEANTRSGHALLLLAEAEHELDWGESGDTCLACAELRTVAAIKHWFDDGGYNSLGAIAILRDHRQNLCPKDEERRKDK